MIDKKRERWKELCEQASVEQDPERLMELVSEINRLLDEKYERVKSTEKDLDLKEP